MHSRKRILGIMTGWLLLALSVTPAIAQKKPNILVIMNDDFSDSAGEKGLCRLNTIVTLV